MDQPPRQGNGGKKKRSGRSQNGSSQKPHTPPSPQTSTPSQSSESSPLTLEASASLLQQLSLETTEDIDAPPGVEFVPDPTLPQAGIVETNWEVGTAKIHLVTFVRSPVTSN